MDIQVWEWHQRHQHQDRGPLEGGQQIGAGVTALPEEAKQAHAELKEVQAEREEAEEDGGAEGEKGCAASGTACRRTAIRADCVHGSRYDGRPDSFADGCANYGIDSFANNVVDSCANGRLLERKLVHWKGAAGGPARPMATQEDGATVSTMIPGIEPLLENADGLVVGGGKTPPPPLS